MNNKLHVIARQIPISAETYEENIENFSDWTSSVDAVIGFDDASFTLRGSKLYLEDWYTNGLGRQITRYSPDGNFMVWQGYVSQMTLTEPGSRSTISLDGIANNVQAKYVAVDTTTNPPTNAQTATLTAAATDTDSQARYGTHDENISVGETTATLAAQKRDQYLNRVAWPLADDQYDTQQTNDLSLSIQCKGWGHSLGWRIYNQTTNSGTANASTVFGDVVTLIGEFIASLTAQTNTSAIPQYFDDDRNALEILKGIVSVGDATGARWIMPMLEDRALTYKPAATAVEYYRRVSDNRQTVREKSGRPLPPWEVRPDHWMRTTDIFPITAGDPTDLIRDPQVRYIEKVTWSEPYGLTMFGSQKSFMANLLAAGSISGNRVT